LPNAPRHDFSGRLSELLARFNMKTKLKNIPGLPLPSPRWYPLLGAMAGFLFILLFIGGAGQNARARMSIPHDEWLNAELHPAVTTTRRIRRATLRNGDHAVAALQRLGFSINDAHRMITAANASYHLKNIRAGHIFKRIDTPEGTDFYYNIDADQLLHLHRNPDQNDWHANVDKLPVNVRQRIASGVISGSLFGSAERAGLDQRTTMNLVNIFAWDIDFARDIRSGDSFKVIYEERFDDAGRILGSTILAARFVNQGRTYQAVRYQLTDGRVDYFTPTGKSLRKAYLKAPVKFSRISSRFTLHRKHPILGYTRAHRGVDYAAPMGTPIHAIGDGHIIFKGWRGGYGRFILIRHTNRLHETAYGHMSRYARGIRRGQFVKQGQIIGYVGMSGLATGPHLHFEFRVRGRAVNPLTIKHPPARPIARAERDRFMQQTAPLLSQLKQPQTEIIWG